MQPKKNTLIYVAGPLFTIQERLYLEKIRDFIHACGATTFLPHLDNNDNAAGRGSDASREKLRSIFQGDYEAIRKADAIIAILDGVPIDVGTAWELGFGYALGKPMLGVRTDFRVLGNFDNQRIDLMAEAACTNLIFVPDGDFTKVEEGIRKFLIDIREKH